MASCTGWSPVQNACVRQSNCRASGGARWRTPGGGFIRSGVVLADLVLDPEEYDGVDWEDGSPEEEQLVAVEEAVFMVRKTP